MEYARTLADAVARAMRHYPIIIGYPPRLFDVDESFSTFGLMRSFHVPATLPRGNEDNA
jgi:hypothetical protein